MDVRKVLDSILLRHNRDKFGCDCIWKPNKLLCVVSINVYFYSVLD